MKKVRISAVSYLNTLPFIYGMEKNNEFMQSVSLSKDIPSECARKLLNQEVDLGLIPVAVIPELKEANLLSDYCIGAIGAVKSVLLLSDVPLEKIKVIYLDYQSRTSIMLCKILCKKFWNISPQFVAAEEGYEKLIEGTTAGVVIGDRTFHMDRSYHYHYDLSEEWMKWKKLPFVFAAWVSNKELSKDFVQLFNRVLNDGVQHIRESIQHYQLQQFTLPEQLNYLTESIDYKLDDSKKKGLEAYLEEVKQLGSDV